MDFRSALSPLPSPWPLLFTSSNSHHKAHLYHNSIKYHKPHTSHSSKVNIFIFPFHAQSIYQPAIALTPPTSQQAINALHESIYEINTTPKKNKNKANQLLPPSLHPIHPFHPNANSNLLFRIKQSKAKQNKQCTPPPTIPSILSKSIPFHSSLVSKQGHLEAPFMHPSVHAIVI